MITGCSAPRPVLLRWWRRVFLLGLGRESRFHGFQDIPFSEMEILQGRGRTDFDVYFIVNFSVIES